MRPLLSRRAATAVVCAALLLGTAGPAVAASHDPSSAAGADRVHAPLPSADALEKQVRPLSDAAGVLSPVTGLVSDVLKADNGRLPAANADKHAVAIDNALATVRKTAPAAPVPGEAAQNATTLPADATDDALAAVKGATDGLIKATAAASPADVVRSIQDVVASLVSLLTNLLGGLLPGLPALPATSTSAPAAPQLPAPPQLPATSELPALPAQPRMVVPGLAS